MEGQFVCSVVGPLRDQLTHEALSLPWNPIFLLWPIGIPALNNAGIVVNAIMAISI